MLGLGFARPTQAPSSVSVVPFGGTRGPCPRLSLMTHLASPHLTSPYPDGLNRASVWGEAVTEDMVLDEQLLREVTER